MLKHFKVLYMSYYKKVYSTCFMVLKNSSLAEEATQEAFMKAYEQIDSLRDSSKFGAWVTTIAYKHSIDIYNKNKKIIPIEDQETLDYFGEDKFHDNPHDKVEEEELRNEMKEAIKKLKPPLSLLIILKYYYELTDDEIADLAEMPVGTVKSSLHRARKSLSRILPSINKEYLNSAKRGVKCE